jgi:hypothetical protein
MAALVYKFIASTILTFPSFLSMTPRKCVLKVKLSQMPSSDASDVRYA